MKTYTYRALFEPGDDSGIIVTFPDVPEAITEGQDEPDARAMAADALGLALLTYIELGRPLPARSRRKAGVPITVDAGVAAKLAVLEAFAASGKSKSELARLLGKDEKEVRRILDPLHRTKLPTLAAALEALGHRLVVGVEEIDAKAA